MIIYMLYYDSDSSIIFKRKLLIRRFRKYIFGSLNRTESKDMIENINSLNCTSVFLDTSTIQKNTSIIQGLPRKTVCWIFPGDILQNILQNKTKILQKKVRNLAKGVFAIERERTRLYAIFVSKTRLNTCTSCFFII